MAEEAAQAPNMRHLSMISHGIQSDILLDGEPVKGVRVITVRHEVGDVPRATLELISKDGAEIRGEANIAIVFHCPVCDFMWQCHHDHRVDG